MPSAQPPRPSKMAAALQLAAQGFDVFPIIPNDKRPLVAGWQRLATQDPERIREWWASEPDANIGVTTERMLVVDIDPRKGGKETMAEMQMLGTDFPPTVASITAGGGAHLMFALPDNLTLSGGNNLFGQGVDVKSHGGYIVAPGSTINNAHYAWVPGHSPTDRHITNVPMWMVDKCQRPTARTTSAGTAIVEEDESAKARAEHWLAKHAPEAVDGERDNKAFTVAAKLYDFGVSTDTCREYLCEWNETMCHPPLDTDDIERLVHSAAKNRRTAIGARHPDAPGFETHEIDTSKAPKTSAQLDTNLPDEKPKRPALYHLTYNAAAEAALNNTNEPLIEDLLDRQAMSVLYGESNSGKTFVMLDIAFAVASGKPWAQDQKTRQGAVVYVAAEGGKGILKRIRALKERYPEAGDIPLYVVPCPVDLLRPDADLKPLVAEIHAIAETYGVAIEMVVIDTLSRAIAGGNENDSQDMGALVRHLDLLRAHTRAHVAVVHHTGKDKAKGARGHSLLRAATDTEIEIDERRLTVTKQRDMEGGLALSFRLLPIDLGTDKEGRSLKSCTVAWAGPGEAGEALPLTGEETDWLNALRISLEKRDNGDPTQCFDVAFFSQSVAENATYLPENRVGKLIPRQTANRWLAQLAQKGVVKIVMRGQWVMANAQNAQNAQSVQGKMPILPGTLRGRAMGKPEAVSTGRKEKTRQHFEAAAEFGI